MATKLNLVELHLLTNFEIMSIAQSKVQFFFEGVSVNIKERRRLKDFIGYIFKKERMKLASINFVFCNDKIIRKMNTDYLGHNYETDIITFDLSEQKRPVLAEVYISIDRVRENALNHHVQVSHELHRVIFHGILHLCGYLDKNAAQKKEMRRKEDAYLKMFFN